MGQLQKYRDDFITLAEAGFIAVGQMDEDAATKLFRAAELLKPDNMLPKIGRGYLHLCKLELKKACALFEEVLKTDPNNEMAKAFLGISLSLTPTETMKGERILDETAKKAHDPAIKKLADNAIEFVEKFVKKSPTPVQGHKKEHKPK